MTDCRGFTILEALVGLAILGIALAGILPSFLHLMNANSLSEQRSNSAAAAQQAMEALRRVPPSTIPSSGSSAVQTIDTGRHKYEVVAHYCLEAGYCDSETRHIVLEVSFGGKVVYTVESVYTRLR